MEKKKKAWPVRLAQWLFPWKGDSLGEVMRKLVFLLALIVFIGAAGYLGNYFYQRYLSSQTAQEISGIYHSDTVESTIPLPDGYLAKFGELYQINQDIKGWIQIPDTRVDFPVLQSTDNDYYLRRNIYKSYDNNGTPFLDYRSRIEREDSSTNLLIYGHNMKFDGMFGSLIHYNNLDFYKAHPLITFDSVYEEAQWKVLAAFYVNTRPEDDHGRVFDYQNYLELQDKDRFDEYVDEMTKRSVVQTNVDVQYGDHLLSLSTCADEFTDGRFVVVARKVRPGETTGMDLNQASYNANTVYPEIWYKKFPNTPHHSE